MLRQLEMVCEFCEKRLGTSLSKHERKHKRYHKQAMLEHKPNCPNWNAKAWEVLKQ